MDIGIVGASGRMGQVLIRLVSEDENFTLKGVSDREGSPFIGKDIGLEMFGRENGVIVADNPLDAFKDCQGIIDFSTPASTIATSEIAGITPYQLAKRNLIPLSSIAIIMLIIHFIF